MPNIKKDWIVNTGGSEIKDSDLIRYNNKTNSEMKQILTNLVKEAHSDDCYNRRRCKQDFETCKEKCSVFFTGPETPREIEEIKISDTSKDVKLYASAEFDEYYLDFTAVPLSSIKTYKEEK